jgi:hypothetical protein
VDFLRAETIGRQAFGDTGETALTITLGDTPPTLGTYMFLHVTGKHVTVLAPSGAVSSYNTNTTWQTTFMGGTTNITLTIKIIEEGAE